MGSTVVLILSYLYCAFIAFTRCVSTAKGKAIPGPNIFSSVVWHSNDNINYNTRNIIAVRGCIQVKPPGPEV